MGICLSGSNFIYKKDSYGFCCKFLPQILFLTSTIGYMDFLIIFKWLKQFSPLDAPSIINKMISMVLELGAVDGPSMWNVNQYLLFKCLKEYSNHLKEEQFIEIYLHIIVPHCYSCFLIKLSHITQLSENIQKQGHQYSCDNNHKFSSINQANSEQLKLSTISDKYLFGHSIKEITEFQIQGEDHVPSISNLPNVASKFFLIKNYSQQSLENIKNQEVMQQTGITMIEINYLRKEQFIVDKLISLGGCKTYFGQCFSKCKRYIN